MTMSGKNHLSPQLRAIESDIDNAYKTNPLVKLNFSEAGWNLLAFGEDLFFKQQVSEDHNTIHKSAVLADTFINALCYPLHWCYSSCSGYGRITSSHNNYQSTWDLLDLGINYVDFCTVFTYASRGMIELGVEAQELIAVHDLLDHSEYEAYNRLIRPSLSSEAPVSAGVELLETIRASLRISNDRFSYKLTRPIANRAQQAIGSAIDQRFALPDTWKFSRYSLGDFRRVFRAITGIAFAHWCARCLATSDGHEALGCKDSIFLTNRDDLLTRIENYSGVKGAIVSDILDDLTYGNFLGRMSDPALQPLIPLNPKIYAIMPHLWINSSAERNLTVLLNRLPAERTIYSRLVAEKESLMKEKFEKSIITQLHIRTTSGPVPGDASLPDIDFAIIDDEEKVCIIFELKWFIEPAVVREVIEKTQELKKGVQQLIALKRAFESKHQPLLTKLKIDASYRLFLTLASENWIGHSDAQHPEVAIIKASHFLNTLMAFQDLHKSAEWLNSRAYLPIKDTHYTIAEVRRSIRKWSLNWYGIKPLITEPFLQV
ncbi:MAG: hypothetical protein AB7J53_14115 [Nitrospira sp.]